MDEEKKNGINHFTFICFFPIDNLPAGPLISWRIKGRRVTMPEPRGKKSLKKVKLKKKKNIIYVMSSMFLDLI